MKNQLAFRTFCLILILIIVSCVPDIEPNVDTEQNTSTEVLLETLDGFDFKTHGVISIKINDSEEDAYYEIYSQFKSLDSQLPDSLQLNYDEVKKDNIVYNFKSSGMTQNGYLEQNISIPNYADKVFIRRKGAEGFTDYVEPIINQSVLLNHNNISTDSWNSEQPKSWTTLQSPLSGNIFVNGNAWIAGDLNTNGFDLEVTGNLIISGNTNLAATSSVSATNITTSGKVNLNGGLIYTDQITNSGGINGPGYIYYCSSYTITGNVNNNQSNSVLQQQCGNDSDADGVADIDDAYPDDSTKAYQIFSPSPSEYGLLLFEDLWPSFGDYDFNDVPLRYRSLVITNAQNQAVQIDFICDVKSATSGFTNGIGIEYVGLNPSNIQSVTGPIYTEGYITNNDNGTEAGQDNAVIIFTDNADNLLTQTTISIVLSSPISTDLVSASNFNPFIISDQNRAREIHLANKPSTSLGSSAIDNGGINSDPSGNFISSQGFSWGLSFLEDIPTPKEAVRISDAYNFFIPWAASGGENNKDWYKDLPGLRNLSLLNE